VHARLAEAIVQNRRVVQFDTQLDVLNATADLENDRDRTIVVRDDFPLVFKHRIRLFPANRDAPLE
jgi:hypothetical protein